MGSRPEQGRHHNGLSHHNGLRGVRRRIVNPVVRRSEPSAGSTAPLGPGAPTIRQDGGMEQSTPRTWHPGYRMRYPDKDGREHILTSAMAARLVFVQEAKERFGQRTAGWQTNHVRDMEDRGLIEVEWLEPDDTERRGAWAIRPELTEVGKYALAQWEKRMAERAEKKKKTEEGTP